MIVAFTGAGISKASGIDTFMEQPEVRNKLYRSFARTNPKEYRETIKTLKKTVDLAQANDAHQALREYDIKIITMNIDGLHESVGSKPLNLHGTLPGISELNQCDTLYNKPVLYGDPAPMYEEAFKLVSTMDTTDTLLVIGASNHTAIAQDLRNLARSRGAKIVEIQNNAQTETRRILELLHQPSD